MLNNHLKIYWLGNLVFLLNIILILFLLSYRFMHFAKFPIREIKVVGQYQHLDEDQVSMISDRFVKGNFFSLDLYSTKEAFTKLPWIRNVSLRRVWPDRLEVFVEEHQAIGRWGAIALVNENGEIFHGASDEDLPLFFGPDGTERYIALEYKKMQSILDKKQLKIAQVSLSSRYTWDIRTTNNMKIILSKDNIEENLNRFMSQYDNILASVKRIGSADLRYPNGFAIKKSTEAIQKIDSDERPLI